LEYQAAPATSRDRTMTGRDGITHAFAPRMFVVCVTT
jgi:hypothetical protein